MVSLQQRPTNHIMEPAINHEVSKTSEHYPLRDMFLSPSTSENHEASLNGVSVRVPLDRIQVTLKQPHRPMAPLIQGSVKKETAIATHTNIHGLTKEKEEAIREIYDRLDMDNDGTIDIRDLTMALKHEYSHIPSTLAPKIIERISQDDTSSIDFQEFVQYVIEHEKRLELIFKDLDRNKDGILDLKEIKSYCNDLGIPISDSKAQSIIEKMDRTGSATIELAEFKDFMLLYPSSDPKEFADFWRHNLVIDIGEDVLVPEDFSDQEMQSGVWWRHLVAGGVAGCMSRTCTAPLDRVKVFLQVHSSKQNNYNLVTAIRYLYKEGGLVSFWRGNGINVLKIAPESACKFMAYEQVKRVIQRFKGNHELTVCDRFLAGSSAGAISQTIIYPLEVLKTRLALRKTGELDRGLWNFAAKLYKNEGFGCFYKGYVPNLIGIIPYAGIDLAIYETLKKFYVKKHPENKEPGVLAILAIGTTSSTIGQLSSYPLALVRTRLQARSISNDPNQPDSMRGQFNYILKNEGFAGLYRGILPNFLKVIPAVSISYVVYESARKQLGATMT